MQSAQLPFRSYEGTDPCVFVSYSHKDSSLVFRIIGKLHALGFHLWYDEGIDPGTEWPEEIANHLISSSVFLLFLSPNSIDSHNVRREINFAIENKKQLICVYLEPTILSSGMQMQLSLIQSIHYSYPNEDDFMYRLNKVLAPLSSIVPVPPKTEPAVAPAHPQKKGSSKRWFILAGVAVVVIVALVVCLFLLPPLIRSMQPQREVAKTPQQIDARENGTIYSIADYYTEEGSFSRRGIELAEQDSEKVLVLERGDWILVGNTQYEVVADSFTAVFYTQSSLDSAIIWWSDFLDSAPQVVK